MRALGTVLAVLAALIWSAIVWGGYALLAMSSDFLAGNAGGVGLPPEVAGWASLLGDLLRDYGTGIAAAIWAIGLLAILALRALYNWLLGMAAPAAQTVAPPSLPQQPAPAAPAPSLPPAIPGPAPADAGTRWGRNAQSS